jgi:glycosyltransferase involved in cell wall biosynthesis
MPAASAASASPERLGYDPVASAAWDCPFVINGRFYSQPTTGVQRYAREITLALDGLLRDANGRGLILAPDNAAAIAPLQTIDVQRVGPLDGHVWEQLVLPLRAEMPILNLCNTAPAATARQIVCMHDANVFIEPGSYSLAFRQVYHALLPWLARRATTLTSVSKASALQLAAHLPVAARDIVVLPNGHEHVFRWNAAASRLAGHVGARRPFVLLLGSRAKHKNAGLILDQADALDALGLDLVVAGGGAGIFSKAVLLDRPNVAMLGVVSDDDLAFLYSRAHCLAFPSLTEGFGLPIVEAMALGCPVIASDRASMPEVCGSAALLAAPDDVAAWHAHFVALTGSATLADDLRGRGREQVRRFSWTESARGYLEIGGVLA